MKKLTSVSPFLLLLVPVFVMMILTFTTGIANTPHEDSVAKSAVSKSSIASVNSALTK